MAVTAAVSAKWGPFPGPHEASQRLGSLVDGLLDPQVGVAWSSLGELTPLRKPAYDADGFGDVLVFGWDLNIPPPPPQTPSGWGRFVNFLESALAQMGQAQYEESQAEVAGYQQIGAATASVFKRMFDAKNRDDGLGVGLDILCVGLSLAALATPVGWIGLAAFAGSVTLLAADGAAYGAELSGHDEAAEGIKEQTQVIRVCATLMTLPDAFWGGFKTIKEMEEIRSLRAGSLRTAARADADAMRATNYARKYAAIAEKARLRAAARMDKFRFKWVHEMGPRAAGLLGAYPLGVEITDPADKGQVAQFLRQYSFHIVSTHQGN